MEQEILLGKNWFYGNHELTEYVIPEGVKRIGESCFENCINLKKVQIPDSVVGIHKRAFFGCENLEEINLPENLQHIPEEMFSGCIWLKRIVLPSMIKMISNNAFAGCCSLEEVVIPNEKVKIANTAFEGCTALKFDNAVAIADHFIKPLRVLIHNKANGIGERQTICEKDERLTVSTCEFQDDCRGHTFDTLQQIQTEHPDALLFFLIGADKLNVIPRWHQSRQFFETFDFAVVCRNGANPSETIQKNRVLSAYEEIFHLIEETEGISEISSTAVRNMLKNGDRTAESLLSTKVYEEVLQMVQHKDIDSFRGDYDFLSNFYEAVINYQEIQYLNNEAAFQAQKCLDEAERMEFSYLSAAKAKRKGRQVSLRPDWEQVKVQIMEEIVRAKFSQNPRLAEKLVATADRKLVEGNTWNDTFWGVDAANGKGENHLGKILMKIRSKLIVEE